MSTRPSPCCAVSKNHAGRLIGAPDTSFEKWWTLSLVTAGSSSVPASSVPNTGAMRENAFCRIVVISWRSVMMSYSSTPRSRASANAVSSAANPSASIAIGLSASVW